MATHNIDDVLCHVLDGEHRGGLRPEYSILAAALHVEKVLDLQLSKL